MKKRIVTGSKGKKVTILEPENTKDVRKLQKMVAAKKADGRVSFGDMRGE